LPKDKNTTFSLAFESQEERGYLELVNEAKLSQLLNLKDSDNLEDLTEESVKNYPVKLVFVSACYSEPIGQLFKKANVPIVIAVNQMTPIADDFARNFTQNFYDTLIKGTVTPRKAFEIAKNSVNGKDKDKFCCCCTHAHEKTCKYLQYLREKKIPKDCYLHTPKCNCSKRYEGYHKLDCKFLTKFKTDLGLPMIPPDYDPNSNWELLCCCKHS